MRRIFDIPPTEAKELFTYLERLGVGTTLDYCSRQKAIGSLDSLINQVTDRPIWCTVDFVASIILEQLRKSKEIDVDLFNQVIQFYPNFRGPPSSNKPTLMWDSDEEEEEEEEKEEEEEEEEEGELSEPEDDHGLDLDFLFKVDWEELEKRKAKQRVPTEQDKIHLLNVCQKWGCTLKKGHEQKIVDLMIPFLSTEFPIFSLSRRAAIDAFVEEILVDYVDSTCTLNDLDTVNHAIERVKKAIEEEEEEEDNRKKEQQISHRGLFRDITVPTNEDGDTTPMNQFNQEIRDCGMECKNATSLNLAERKDICLTTSVNEQAKEYGNVVTPLKPEEEEESTVNVDVCLTPEWKEMEIEEYGNVVTPLKPEEEEESTVGVDVCLTPEWKDMEIEDRLKRRKRKLGFSHPVSV